MEFFLLGPSRPCGARLEADASYHGLELTRFPVRIFSPDLTIMLVFHSVMIPVLTVQMEKTALYRKVVPPALLRFTKFYIVGGLSFFVVAPSVFGFATYKIRTMAHTEGENCVSGYAGAVYRRSSLLAPAFETRMACEKVSRRS